ncbi:ribonuclease T(2) [Sinorhizobium numidicum]|uniref:Ribonuclease T(2) n=1 Tax=Sinorhizobium numidicum TaxID=680248 RepID=A0ABY8CTE5_9HYPH|nr:ribonuclease T(2) [Sinorhizobium numidicum]WEX78517.1 ribonuclease T(2) [Sinorhizobium numidicum]WEX81914.1 ribonuclease T(2) [Sinorhizobium numidicum]
MAARKLLPTLVGILAIAGCSDEGAKNTLPSTRTDTEKAAASVTVPVGKGFDFYVLSLSWSPTWCDANDPKGKSDQCEAGSGHGLIVHGLWPQNEDGYPEFCPTRQSDRVPEALGRQYLDLIPSMGLIGHQWRKHGSCSGLRQADYFAVTRAARERLAIPPELTSNGGPRDLSVPAIEAALAAKNPGMTKNMIAVTCEGRLLEEIRICFDKELKFRACPEVDRQACRRSTVLLPPAP